MASSLLVPARTVAPHTSGLLNRVTAEEASWEHLGFEVRRLASGDSWTWNTGGCEAALVMLGGFCAVESSAGRFDSVGGRADVWSGLPHTLYLPRGTELTVRAAGGTAELALCWVPTDRDHPARLVTPEQVKVEVRGGRSNTRQINHMIWPGFDCHRIVCCEVYTPSGNWSSYPPHKHDRHVEDDDGTVLEADLEEIYYYKIRGPRGFAIQRVYTDDRALDEALVAHDDDIVLVPEGYHPVSAAYGYDCYYLNFLAGSAQTLAATDDPDYAWVKETWTELDPRLPMVSLDMER